MTTTPDPEPDPEVVMVQSLGPVPHPGEGGKGETGRTGERGKQGDHGQDGATGPALLTQAQTIAVVLFVLLAGLLLAWRSEVNAANIRDNASQIAQNQYDECLARNANVDRLNTLYTGLVKIERDNPFSSTGQAAAKTVQRRIDLYTANMLVRINCGERP